LPKSPGRILPRNFKSSEKLVGIPKMDQMDRGQNSLPSNIKFFASETHFHDAACFLKARATTSHNWNAQVI